MTFVNEGDFISFRCVFDPLRRPSRMRRATGLTLPLRPSRLATRRHHVFVKTSHKEVQLAEVGPRFEMRRECFPPRGPAFGGWAEGALADILFPLYTSGPPPSFFHSQHSRDSGRPLLPAAILNLTSLPLPLRLPSSRSTAYEIKQGTIEQVEADTEWVLRPYQRTARKRNQL